MSDTHDIEITNDVAFDEWAWSCSCGVGMDGYESMQHAREGAHIEHLDELRRRGQ